MPVVAQMMPKIGVFIPGYPTHLLLPIRTCTKTNCVVFFNILN